MKPANTVLQIIAAVLFTVGVVNGTRTYDIVQGTGAADISAWIKTALPILSALGISGTGLLSQFWDKIRGGKNSMPILESIKTLLEQFQAKGIPDSVSIVATWGEDTYDLQWSKRRKAEAAK